MSSNPRPLFWDNTDANLPESGASVISDLPIGEEVEVLVEHGTRFFDQNIRIQGVAGVRFQVQEAGTVGGVAVETNDTQFVVLIQNISYGGYLYEPGDVPLVWRRTGPREEL